MRIAIVGAGISGLTAASLLRDSHEITLFEAGEHLGGHTQTVDVDVDGEQHAIDTGFIVFNRRTYPRLSALLDELGVNSRPTLMGFSVRCDRTGLEYCGSSLGGLFCQKRNLFRPRFYQMLRNIWRFDRNAQKTILDRRAKRAVTGADCRGFPLTRPVLPRVCRALFAADGIGDLVLPRRGLRAVSRHFHH